MSPRRPVPDPEKVRLRMDEPPFSEERAVHVGALPGWQQFILDPDKRQPNVGPELWLFPTGAPFRKERISDRNFRGEHAPTGDGE
jgi:hypothetical protein